jgi:hypothetical protein
VYTLSWLDTAEGAQLDNLGDIVGEPRKGRADDLYRIWIRARIAVNRGNGKVSDVLKVARLVVGEGPVINYITRYPAAYDIELIGSTTDNREVAAILNEARGAGIGMRVHEVDDAAHAFTLDDLTAPDGLDPYDVGLGQLADPAEGGILTEVI